MADAAAATEQLVFDQLIAHVDGAAIFQDAPVNAAAPLVIIGDLLSSPFGRSDDPDRRITLTIVIITEGDERAPCVDLQRQIETALGGRSFNQEGWNLHVSLESSAAELDAEGAGYLGTTILTILAFSDG